MPKASDPRSSGRRASKSATTRHPSELIQAESNPLTRASPNRRITPADESIRQMRSKQRIEQTRKSQGRLNATKQAGKGGDHWLNAGLPPSSPLATLRESSWVREAPATARATASSWSPATLSRRLPRSSSACEK